jgi:hypothetical protein
MPFVKPAFLLSVNSLTIHFKGGISKTIQRTEPLCAKVLDLLKVTNPATEEEILTTIDPAKRVRKHACGLFEVGLGGIYIDGERCPDLFSKRALEIADLGLDASPLVSLWRNIKQNPDPVAVKDLYVFLDRRQHPITPDGCFIAYKRVKSDFKDWYTGRIDNSVDAVTSMPRSEVDCNPANTCSRGLHVASLEYARDSYQSGQGVLIAVKVHPKNVCAIPPDYNMTKMRTCGYEVLEVLEDQSKPIVQPVYAGGEGKVAQAAAQSDLFSHVKQPDSPKALMEIDKAQAASLGARVHRATDDNHKNQKRDSRGHFIPKSKLF